MVGPEIELILCSARAAISPNVEARMRRLVQDKLDWDYVVAVAHSHGTLPLLHKRLEEHCASCIRPAVRVHLRELFDRNAKRNLLLTAELLKLLGIFKRCNLPVIPYKGPALAAFVYGDYALRRTDDLDILVRKDDVWRSVEILGTLGFQPATAVTRRQMPIYFRSECDLSLVHRQTRLIVELHWAIAPPFYGLPLETDDLLRGARHVKLAGADVPMPTPENLLIALCIHGAKHHWERLEWIASLAALTGKEFRLDWERILSCAAMLRGKRTLLLGLALAHELLGAEIPDPVLARIQEDKAVELLVRAVQEHLFSEKPPGSVRQTIFRLRTHESIADRVRYCALRAWTPTYKDLRFVSLPTALFPLYYLLRPVRLGLASAWYPFKKKDPGDGCRRLAGEVGGVTEDSA
jgi:hypothetical protein